MRSQFYPSRNKGKDPAQIGPGSRAKIWWLVPECGHEWVETPHQRGKRFRWRCPECRTVLDSLAWHYPELAEEWADTNLASPWKLRPGTKLAYTPEWVCSKNPEHRWQASMTSRAKGGQCPECIGTGKSAIELEHHRAAEDTFGNARSGVPLYSDIFTRRGRWVVDILCTLPDAAELVIEYDGAYWHREKAAADTGKSLDLLQAGYLVARLREDTLPSLDIGHPRYTEFTVYSTAPDAPSVIGDVHGWAIRQTSAADEPRP